MSATEDPSCGRARFIAVFWIIIGAAALAVLLLGIAGYPVPWGDSAFFIPAAISWKVSGQFVNEFWPGARSIDPTGHSRFLYHLPMLEWTIKSLMRRPVARDALTVLAMINAVSLTTFGLLAWNSFSVALDLACQERDRWLALAYHLAACLSFLGMLFYDLGRPEALAAIMVIAGVLMRVIQ